MSWISSRQDPTGCLLRFRVPFAQSEALSHEELGVILIEATTKMALFSPRRMEVVFRIQRNHVTTSFFLGVHWQPMFDLIQIFCHEV